VDVDKLSLEKIMAEILKISKATTKTKVRFLADR